MNLSTLPESLEGEDEPAVPVVRFISGEQLFREIDSIQSASWGIESRRRVDTLLVTSVFETNSPPCCRALLYTNLTLFFSHRVGVSPAALDMLERKRETRGRKFRFNWYDEDSRRLLVCLNTGAHVQLHIWLYCEIIYALWRMGLDDNWNTMGATSFYHGSLNSDEELGNTRFSHGNGGGSSGEPDSSGGPWPERRGRGAFPTLVIEAGCTRSLAIMQAKAKWWFKISNHDVKIVLLAKFYPGQQMTVVEKWEERPREIRKGAATTRWGSEGVPSCQQVVTITKTNDDPLAYHISGDLVLSFRLLFLRDPGEGERDVVISTDRLQGYAEMVWGDA
ncbi:hypothetical protein THARTR1_02220 [Trichoderma harzianum]|uniref:Uncharacterized protein n=1 Tax=Trichoderma harzianum TaxID=5544 RepID=A0A2K0UJU9_TRIHA|nr:hypothetical protein THARTR1_02220 [Trichoderma harzianum]